MNDCVLGFNGERLDPASGATHLGNGYRAYNPVLMRFNCQDPWSPFGAGGINTYVYCAGDPVNLADPSGHHSLWGWLGIGAGVALGTLLTPVSGGTSLAVVLSVASIVTAAVSTGFAIAQQFIEDFDSKTAAVLGWAALGTGTVSVLSSAALLHVSPEAKSLTGLLKGNSNRPFRGLMMEEGAQSSAPANYGPVSELIGRGGTATVYRIKQGILLKVFRNRQRPIELTVNEVEATIAANGPGSAKIINNAKMMMREAEGRPLSDFHDLSWFSTHEQNELLNSVRNRLHSRGIIHRDLSPENIFVVESTAGGPRKYNFIDFGFAKLKATEQEKLEELYELEKRMKRWSEDVAGV